ncbi:unnamed protein product [Lactuca virosa]|uniref:Uncharacterized protein n=1 Tax=Lactuca virosa TaxID=75947 RepID=A0AAU9MU65_9ASTR|nr:unnamed protein product [Lactuca virosa]
MRVRKDRIGIKVEEAREDGNRLRAESDAKDHPCSCWCELAVPRCAKWLLYFGCPGGARQQADYIYQEETWVRARARCVVDRTGTHVVARSVLTKAEHKMVAAVVGVGGHIGLQPQMGYQHGQCLPACRHHLLHHYHVTLQERTKFQGCWW